MSAEQRNPKVITRQDAERLVAYFEMCLEETPKDKISWRTSYRRGLDTAEEWLRLIDSECASQKQVADLLVVMKQNKADGSGWYDLASCFYSWAKSTGYDVPPVEVFFAPRSGRNGAF